MLVVIVVATSKSLNWPIGHILDIPHWHHTGCPTAPNKRVQVCLNVIGLIIVLAQVCYLTAIALTNKHHSNQVWSKQWCSLDESLDEQTNTTAVQSKLTSEYVLFNCCLLDGQHLQISCCALYRQNVRSYLGKQSPVSCNYFYISYC